MKEQAKPSLLEYLKYLLPFVIAILMVVGYIYFVYFLMEQSKNAENDHWERMILIFKSIEAIVFAASGFLFGQQINRKRAEKAEEREQRAQTEKNDAIQIAEKAVIEVEDAKSQRDYEKQRGLNLAAAVIANGLPPKELKYKYDEGDDFRTIPSSLYFKVKKLFPELE